MNDPLAYGRLRIDSDDLDEFHRALAYLAADTCQRGRCDENDRCSKHQRVDRRRLRAVQDGEAS